MSAGDGAGVGVRFWKRGDGMRVAWEEFGDPGGRVVMYHHGWPSSRLQARLGDAMARELGVRLVAMDRPGMGQSTFVRGRRLADWPELMAGFADHLGIGRFGQTGVSGGGPYALACAAAMPERVTRTAVLAGAVPLGGLENLAGLHPAYRALIPLRKLPEELFTQGLRLASRLTRAAPGSAPMSWLLRSVAAEDRELLLGDPEIWPVITESFREGVRQGGGGMLADAEVYLQPMGFDPAGVRGKLRYWHGGEDRNIPVGMVRDFVAKIPGAELRVRDSAGHFSMVLGGMREALRWVCEGAGDGDALD